MGPLGPVRTGKEAPLRKTLKVLSLVVIALLLVTGGMVVYLSQGLSGMKELPVGEIDPSRFEDGIYHGRFEGARWTNEVAVSIRDHQIEDIELIEDVRFVSEGVSEEVFGAVVREQSLQVDTVSGATATTNAYLKAIETALR